MSELRIYAHRGATGFSLENTWRAFRKASDSGVGIELDLQITKDGVVIVYHDDNLKRLGGKNLKIEEAEYSSMKELKIGKRWHRRFWHDAIPLGYEVIQWAKEKNVPLNIELKSSFAKHPAGPRIIASMLEGAGDFHVSSFHAELLRDMKGLMPKAEMALILKKRMPLDVLKEMYWIDSIHLHRRLYSPQFIKALHDMEKTVRVYGIRGREAAMKKLAPELKGIITDYPQRVSKKLRLPF